MKKKNFVKIIEAVIAQAKKESTFDGALSPFFSSHLTSDISSHFQAQVVKIIEDEMGDNDSTIEWWIWDAPDAGKDENSSCVFMPDGKRIPLRTSEQLYDHMKQRRITK